MAAEPGKVAGPNPPRALRLCSTGRGHSLRQHIQLHSQVGSLHSRCGYSVRHSRRRSRRKAISPRGRGRWPLAAYSTSRWRNTPSSSGTFCRNKFFLRTSGRFRRSPSPPLGWYSPVSRRQWAHRSAHVDTRAASCRLSFHPIYCGRAAFLCTPERLR